MTPRLLVLAGSMSLFLVSGVLLACAVVSRVIA
jgi:hypothetical protein